MMTPATLAPEEIEALTQTRQAAAQLRKLRACGFTRARIERGRVILERPHFEAVSAGTKDPQAARPTVKYVPSLRLIKKAP